MNYGELKENINKLSIEELKNLLIEFNNKIISEHRFECIKLIIYEIENRRLSRYIKNNVDLKVILDYNFDILWKISDNEIEQSMNFINKNKVQIDGILRWIPVFLSMNIVYCIYNKCKNNGYSDDKILDVLVTNIRTLLNDYVINNNIKYDDNKEFINFILKLVKMINNKIKSTDVYKRMMDEIIEKNSYALSHLR